MIEPLMAWLGGRSLLDVLGTLGVLGYISAYFLLQIGVLKGNGWAFPFFNLAASLCILASLTRDFNPFSAVVEIAWATISIIGLVRLFIIHHRIRFSEDEAQALARLGQGLGKDRARKLVQAGRLSTEPHGTRLATEGQPVSDLALILGGVCHVSKGGAVVATLGQGALIGELTYMSGAAATADVEADGPVRLFRLPVAALRELVATDAEIAGAIELATGADLRRKLVETTERLSRAVDQR